MRKPISFIIAVLIILGIFWYAWSKTREEPTVISDIKKPKIETPIKQFPCEPDCKG